MFSHCSSPPIVPPLRSGGDYFLGVVPSHLLTSLGGSLTPLGDLVTPLGDLVTFLEGCHHMYQGGHIWPKMVIFGPRGSYLAQGGHAGGEGCQVSLGVPLVIRAVPAKWSVLVRNPVLGGRFGAFWGAFGVSLSTQEC